MLSHRMGHAVCGQKRKFDESGGGAEVEKPIKNSGEEIKGSPCGWYKVSQGGGKPVFKSCTEVTKPGD